MYLMQSGPAGYEGVSLGRMPSSRLGIANLRTSKLLSVLGKHIPSFLQNIYAA